MPFYIQLNEDGLAISVTETSADLEPSPQRVQVDGLRSDLLGQIYDPQASAAAGQPVFTAPVAAPEPEPAWAWLIDIGPFVDRLGVKRYALEQSTDPFVMSFRHDVDTRRKWIDLRDPRVAGALAYCAGHPLPGVGTIASPLLTDAEVTAVLTTPVEPQENLALRKLYFS